MRRKRKDAIERAIAESDVRNIVLIAGKGHEDYQDIKGVKHLFDDRVIAKGALELYSKGGN